MSDVAGARKELAEIANQLDAVDPTVSARIRDIVIPKLHRRKPVRGRMPAKSRPVDSRVKQGILALAETTDLHTAEIAAEMGVNPGRVSEVLQGDR